MGDKTLAREPFYTKQRTTFRNAFFQIESVILKIVVLSSKGILDLKNLLRIFVHCTILKRFSINFFLISDHAMDIFESTFIIFPHAKCPFPNLLRTILNTLLPSYFFVQVYDDTEFAFVFVFVIFSLFF